MRPTRLTTATLAAVIAMVGFGLATATPTVASAVSTNGTGLAYTDRTFQPFTASNGLSSQYHVYASGIPQDHAAGLVLQFHGDDAYEFKNPTSSYSLGGASGIVAQSRERGYITVPVLAPDTDGPITWWENGSANADFVADLVNTLKAGYNIDSEDVWLVGYSGGAQFITQFYLPEHSSQINGGGTVVFGGGGVPRVSAAPFDDALVSDLPMHWYTGAADTGAGGYNALRDAQNGSAWYAAKGFITDLESPSGLGHNLSGRFGQVLAQHLDQHVPGTDGNTPTIPTTPAVTPTPTTLPSPSTTTPPSPSTTSPQPQPSTWNHTIIPTRIGADLTVSIPPGTGRTTFRVTAIKGPFYVYNYTTRTGPRTLSIVSSLSPDTTYNYTLEADGTVVESGSFRTLS